jgi:hypothetical protein
MQYSGRLCISFYCMPYSVVFTVSMSGSLPEAIHCVPCYGSSRSTVTVAFYSFFCGYSCSAHAIVDWVQFLLPFHSFASRVFHWSIKNLSERAKSCAHFYVICSVQVKVKCDTNAFTSVRYSIEVFKKVLTKRTDSKYTGNATVINYAFACCNAYSSFAYSPWLIFCL